MRGITRFDHWAMPVYSKPWAFVATVADRLKQATRYKIGALNAFAHHAWCRATCIA